MPSNVGTARETAVLPGACDGDSRKTLDLGGFSQGAPGAGKRRGSGGAAIELDASGRIRGGISGQRRYRLPEAYWRNVVKGRSPEECWGWAGYANRHGYGQVTRRGHHLKAHRYSWEIHFGPIPEGLGVLHHCDNPPCTNPLHLYLGTQKDNIRDAWRRGRLDHTREQHRLRLRGERCRFSKLTEVEVRAIRNLYKGRGCQNPTKPSYLTIGKRFGVSASAVGLIIKREVWTHIADFSETVDRMFDPERRV
jgi:hypothetical protein